MLQGADFDKVFSDKNPHVDLGPKCSPPECFKGSYAPVTKAGNAGPFHVNTYLLQPNRKEECGGKPVAVRSGDCIFKK
jgi:hypothetical protein